MATLKPFLEEIQAGPPIGHRNLQLVPLQGDGQNAGEYVLAADAIEQGVLTVSEVDESGQVPELLAVSESGVMILIINGEELIGAKQDRICNTDVLLPPRATTKIPVSCVEHGRWHQSGRTMRSEAHAPPRVRAAQSRSVGRSLREGGQARSDQGEVWDEVAGTLDALACESPTGALRAAAEQRRGDVQEHLDALPCPDSARGVVVAIGGEFVVLDLFDKTATLSQLWPRLLHGYALDALGRETCKSGNGFGEEAAGELLGRLGGIECQACPSAGLGDDWRFEEKDLTGSALVVDGSSVHLSAFPGRDEGQRGRQSRRGRIARPSRRRNSR